MNNYLLSVSAICIPINSNTICNNYFFLIWKIFIGEFNVNHLNFFTVSRKNVICWQSYWNVQGLIFLREFPISGWTNKVVYLLRLCMVTINRSEFRVYADRNEIPEGVKTLVGNIAWTTCSQHKNYVYHYAMNILWIVK